MGMTRKVYKMQERIANRLKKLPLDERVRRIRFIDAPTVGDIEDARRIDGLIVVRVKAPPNSLMTSDYEVRQKLYLQMADKVLERIGLPNGNPRVMVLVDSFESEVVFQEHVHQMFDR